MKLKDEQLSKELSDILTDSIIRKFKEQGHNLTGKGIASLKTIVNENGNGLVIQIFGADYMGDQNTGLPAGTKPNLESLAKWVQLRGMAKDMRTAKVIAFYVARNMEKIGMHSRNKKIDMSKRGFIPLGIADNQSKFNEILFRMFEKNFNIMVKDLTENNTQLILEL